MFNIICKNILITSILWHSVLSMEESEYKKMVRVRFMVFNATFNNISVISKYEKKITNLLQVINKLYLTIIVLSTSREGGMNFWIPTDFKSLTNFYHIHLYQVHSGDRHWLQRLMKLVGGIMVGVLESTYVRLIVWLSVNE